jgi:hypothetical protein
VLRYAVVLLRPNLSVAFALAFRPDRAMEERSLAFETESAGEEYFKGKKGGFRALPFIFCEFRD